MTRSERFHKAHAIAKQIRNCFPRYRDAFGFALSEVYAEEKKGMIEKTTEQKLEDLGFSAWEKNGAKRYYVNTKDLERVFDVAVRPGKFGDKVYVDGRFGLTKAAEVTNRSAIYYDANAGQWMQNAKAIDQRIVDAIRI